MSDDFREKTGGGAGRDEEMEWDVDKVGDDCVVGCVVVGSAVGCIEVACSVVGCIEVVCSAVGCIEIACSAVGCIEITCSAIVDDGDCVVTDCDCVVTDCDVMAKSEGAKMVVLDTD